MKGASYLNLSFVWELVSVPFALSDYTLTHPIFYVLVCVNLLFGEFMAIKSLIRKWFLLQSSRITRLKRIMGHHLLGLNSCLSLLYCVSVQIRSSERESKETTS